MYRYVIIFLTFVCVMCCGNPLDSSEEINDFIRWPFDPSFWLLKGNFILYSVFQSFPCVNRIFSNKPCSNKHKWNKYRIAKWKKCLWLLTTVLRQTKCFQLVLRCIKQCLSLFSSIMVFQLRLELHLKNSSWIWTLVHLIYGSRQWIAEVHFYAVSITNDHPWLFTIMMFSLSQIRINPKVQRTAFIIPQKSSRSTEIWNRIQNWPT